MSFFFFFNDTATTEIYTLSLHDALPISPGGRPQGLQARPGSEPLPGLRRRRGRAGRLRFRRRQTGHVVLQRSEEHTSELQSHSDLVCRLLLEKKKKTHKSKTERHYTMRF